MTTRRKSLPTVLIALGLILAACSGDSDSGATPTTRSASAADPESLVAQVASYDITAGPAQRVIVGVLTGDQRLVTFGTVRLRFSYLGTAEEKVEPPRAGPDLIGTYLPVPGTEVPDPAPVDPQVVTDSGSRGIYAAQVAFDQPGFWQVDVAARVGGELKGAKAAFEVLAENRVPAPGDDAPRTENLTVDSTDAPRAAIDSRAGRDGADVPDAALHSTTIAKAVAAGRPVVAVFSTPVYCTSRFCGPVTDMIGELAASYGDRASFVHVEVWRDFQEQVINRAAAEWILRPGAPANEPWVFVIGADGKVVARYDNVATRGEIEPLLAALPVIGPAA